MIEGQEDVSWDQWVAIGEACEEHGIPTLFRSDHYFSVFDQEAHGSLDAWGTICGLAARTEKLKLGTMVSPASFRHPSVLAKLVATADQISGGRIEPAIGSGWNEAEHKAFGFPFLPVKERMDVLSEQLEIVTGLWGDGEFEFQGEHYDYNGIDPLPKPVQRPMPLIMGGNAGPRAAALAAKYAVEYNTPNPTKDDVRARRKSIVEAWIEAGRDPETVRFSVMTGVAVGRDEGEANERLEKIKEKTGAGDDLSYEFFGSTGQVVEQLEAFRDLGVDRVMLQLLLHDDLEQIEIIGRELAPALA